ncbi:hypothetical protein T01_15100 [Trichinella spiralis]|uniref:Uncharacterized protein n=1 Tax=Trichinella spiralis TaxID=6334 RepID=A0A0V1B3S8_TRISP|nr:hypothetical protein T01_15100 [Trichinella spiralis]
MAKVKSKTSKILIGLVKEYESDILSTDNTYMQMTKHKSATEKMKTESKKACLLSTFVADSSSKSQFPTDLCMTFIDAGIPLWILGNNNIYQVNHRCEKIILTTISTMLWIELDVKSHTTKYRFQ